MSGLADSIPRFSLDGIRKHKLLTKEIANRLPGDGSTEGKPLLDAVVQAKFFTPGAGWTWFVIEHQDADDEDVILWGLVCGFEAEFGAFSLREVAETRGRFGLPIERDLYFEPKPLREVLVSEAHCFPNGAAERLLSTLSDDQEGTDS